MLEAVGLKLLIGTELLVPGNRSMTAFVLALCFVLPDFLLLFVEYLKIDAL